MKYFRADLHVHSRFSRATSGRLNIRNLAAWSMIKGLSVMSTGDFTHPAWRNELRRDLVYDDNSGLYRVREKTPLETEIPGFSRPDGVSEPQFLIQAEISSIYKKDGSVRKVHNVVIMPSLETSAACSFPRISGRRGFRCLVPNPALTRWKTASDRSPHIFSPWKPAFPPIRT